MKEPLLAIDVVRNDLPLDNPPHPLLLQPLHILLNALVLCHYLQEEGGIARVTRAVRSGIPGYIPESWS